MGTEMAPVFPPPNFEVPDISYTNSLHSTTNSSLESMAMVANSINTSSHNGTILSPSFPPPGAAPPGGQQGSSAAKGTSPPGPVSRESSTEDSDDCLPLAKVMCDMNVVIPFIIGVYILLFNVDIQKY